MSNDCQILLDEIKRTECVLNGLSNRYRQFLENDLVQLGQTDITAAFAAQILESYYTALETLFLKISQFFENTLVPDRWHGDLLDKMALHITSVRERVIEEDTKDLLIELLRFRHFTRYYYELDYDWHKLDYLLGVYERARPLLERDLAVFKKFLAHLM